MRKRRGDEGGGRKEREGRLGERERTRKRGLEKRRRHDCVKV